MGDSKQRTIVDGFAFNSVFQFPKVLRSITMSLQPPRLVIGLVMVLTLVMFGRLWDGLVEPSIAPGGWLAEAPDAQAQAAQQDLFREAMIKYVPESDWPGPAPAEWEALDAREVRMAVEAGYRTLRAEALERSRFEQADLDYLATIEAIDREQSMAPFEATAYLTIGCFRRITDGMVYLEFRQVIRAVNDLMLRGPAAIWRQDKAFAVCYGLLVMFVFAIGGGAISRMAACEFARREYLSIYEAFEFSLNNWVRLLLALILPILIAGVVSVILIVFGALMQVPFLDMVGGILYGLALLLGLFMAFIVLGYLGGFIMLVPAVACENCDAADAQQRAFAYLLGRPVHLLGYVITAIGGLAVGFVIVTLFCSTAMNFTAALAGLLTSNSAMSIAGGFDLIDLFPRNPGAIHDTMHSRFTASAISFWQGILISLVVAWVFAYCFNAATIIYLLMRRTCDGQDPGEIWMPGLVRGTVSTVDASSDNETKNAGS